jgi:hypothetical protein
MKAKIVIILSSLRPMNICQFMFLLSLSIDSTIRANIIQYATRSKAHVGKGAIVIIVNNQTYYTNDLLQESVLSNT